MARKKKQESNKNINLNYKGEISISLVRNNKVVSTKKFHNKGTLALFKFLSHCLSGRYALAENLRPKFIKLYSLGEDQSPVPITPLSYATQEHETTTSFVMYKETPTTVEETNSITTQFTFMVPFTQINLNYATNMLVLYSQSSYANPLAYFIILDEEDKTKLSELFDPESIININEYNLYITWGMKIDNNSISE